MYMKRILVMAAALLMVGTVSLRAQGVKVDVDNLKAQMAKSDADIANPKKSVKAATWLDRGKLFADVAEAPAKGAFETMDEKTADMMFGKGTVKTQKIGDKSYRMKTYPNLTTYATKDGEVWKVQFWEPTLVITDNPLGKAVEAYQKAYSIDQSKGTADKAKAGLDYIANQYKQNAANYLAIQQFEKAAEASAGAADAVAGPPANVVDTLAIYNAGVLYTVALKFDKAIPFLTKALQNNYENNGDAYFYLYHCYYGTKQVDKAKETLLTGLAKWPENTKIVEGLLTIYTTGDGDPKEVIPLVEKAIEKDPKNAGLYSGLGLIYDKLGDYDNAIKSFEQAAKLLPKDYNTNYNLGLLYVRKGDQMNAELGKKVITVPEEYEKELGKINAVFAKAVAPLEKALSIKKDDPMSIELLKNLCFRLRDEPGMMDKYNKYNEMFKALPAPAPAAE